MKKISELESRGPSSNVWASCFFIHHNIPPSPIGHSFWTPGEGYVPATGPLSHLPACQPTAEPAPDAELGCRVPPGNVSLELIVPGALARLSQEF